MKPTFPLAGRAVALLAVLLALPGVMAVSARGEQLSPDQAATMLLDSARRAYNEGKFDVAAARFREFLGAYASHKDVLSAHYGLGLALLDLPQKDYAAAAASLGQVVARADFPDRPLAIYYLGVALRGTGRQALVAAEAKPAEAAALRTAARQQFGQAAKHFADAADALAARAKVAPAAAGDLDWVARARADQCEMLLWTDKFKEAGDLAAALLADKSLAAGPCRDAVTYYLGYARFAQQNYLEAGRALSRLAPFKQDFGGHARYLLARAHHLSGERPEAAAQYQAVAADYAERAKAAQAALANPQALKPEQVAMLQALVGHPPDYLVRAAFHNALILSEDGRYADAVARFTELMQQNPKSPLVPEIQLRRGYCQVQSKNFPPAIADLQPLAEHPQLGDRALWWLARAQVGAADPKAAPAYQQALAGAVEILRRAAERAGALAASDPDAKARRGDILLEMADTQQLAGKYPEAAAAYRLVLGEKNNPDRAEEAMQRLATALHLAGKFDESEEACRQFEAAYPKSTLLPAVLFRSAENAYLAATKAAEAPDAKKPPEELARLFGDVVKRYERLVKEFPEFAYVNLARQALATAHYRMGRYAAAIPVLSAIPETDRLGDLATVPYLLADCYIRCLPPEADDALQAARLIEQAELAAKLLETFIGPAGKGPEAADALVKLGHCYQRIGTVLVDPAERQKMLSQARGAYERALPLLAKDNERLAVAVFERAKCLVLLGDVPTAVAELNRFQADPLRGTTVAPMAVLRLSVLMRAQKKPADAAALWAQARPAHEATLAKDPARRDWIPMLQYEHALALKESGKAAEAAALFDAVAKQFVGRPEAANALWRGVQCRREKLMADLDAARKTAAKPGAAAEELAAAARVLQEGMGGLRQAMAPLQAQADDLGKKSPGAEPHLRGLYELAWCSRVLAGAEIEAAKEKLGREALEKVKAAMAKAAPSGPPPALRMPDIAMPAIPVQPSEKAARDQYAKIIAAAPKSSLAVQARFELAEMEAERGRSDAALDLLDDALGGNLSPSLAEQIRLRLAASFLAKGDAKAALAQAEAVLKTPDSPRAAEARFLAGEACVQQQVWPRAIELLVPFRDQPPLQAIPNLSDRALLRLGHALAQAGQWEPARQTLEALCQRFPQSPWVEDAFYGIGWAWQNLKQPDNAVAAYTQVTRRTVAEVAARAQLQIGLCRLDQGRHDEALVALLAVPLTYDYPDLNAPAWCEAARAYLAKKNPGEAANLLQRVVKDYPKSQWAEVARKRLGEIKKGTG